MEKLTHIPLDSIEPDLIMPYGKFIIRYEIGGYPDTDNDQFLSTEVVHVMGRRDNQVDIMRMIRFDLAKYFPMMAIDIDPTGLKLKSYGVWLMEYDT